MEINVYCDESCHLEQDESNAMGIGAVSCPKDKLSEINNRIADIKKDYGVKKISEIKWAKVSPSKLSLYKAIINYFFDDDDLHFRVLIIPDKSVLDHDKFNQTHDEWYYKMYFETLNVLFDSRNIYNIYVDIKDSHSYEKTQKLKTICCNKQFDFSSTIIKKIQPIRSEEVQIMEITDILTGAVVYANRIKFQKGHTNSYAKQSLIGLIRYRSGKTLTKTTLLRENKMNVLIWEPRKL